MMKKALIIVLAILAINFNGIAQEGICGNEVILQEINKDPVAKAKFDQFWNDYTQEKRDYNRASSKSTGTVTIPLVFHVVLTSAQLNQLGGTPGLYERIQSQLEVVREDFTAKNFDLVGVPEVFKPVIGNAEIFFEIAKIAEDGSAKFGVEVLIKDASFTGFAVHNSAVKRASAGGLDPWDVNKYVNIWVTNITSSGGGGGSGGQVLGYGYSPSYAAQNSSPNQAGVVMHYLTLGRRTNQLQAFFSPNTEKGRTLTHELGHYFNIFHIWGNTPVGSGNCNDDDTFGDTPRQQDANQTCPTVSVIANCSNDPHPGGEMYMNYMDYSGDECTRMFTKEQVARMRVEVEPGGDSYSIAQNAWRSYWPTGVSEIDYFNKVSIGPNPTNGIININFLEKLNKLNNIVVYNNMGQIIKTVAINQQNSDYTIDITNAAAGLYIVHLQFDEGVISRKVVLQ